jgi:alkanesulfonate monooxygenase SsuD/methylene tetrahydromethanopterin reductase-like flavin-dependent oxidoreductase (luciferase family)
MEFATLGAAYPGRFMAGLGHGVAGWLRQMGLEPASPLTLLRESTAAIGKLLTGAEVTESADYVDFDAVHLHHPVVEPVPVYLGVHGPASLRLSGELADGTLLGWFSSPGYVAWARDRIEEGRRRSDRTGDHELVVLCVLATSEDDARRATQDLWQWAAPLLASMTQSPQLQSSEQGRDLADFLATDAVASSTAMPPHQLFGEFAATGDLQSCAETVYRLLAAGADRVVLVPNPAGYRSTPQMLQQMRIAAPLASIA